jgi:hypothetical protein
VDAATGAVDTFTIPPFNQYAWSPSGERIVVRATPAAAPAGRRDMILVCSVGSAAGEGRITTLCDSIITEERPAAKAIAWLGPDLLAALRDTSWTLLPLAPGAASLPGWRSVWASPVGTGASTDIQVGAVDSTGRFEVRSVIPPPSLLAPPVAGTEQRVLWWQPVRLRPDGSAILVSAMEKEAGVFYLLLAPDGRILREFRDGLTPGDLSEDGRWILAHAEITGTERLENSELFLVRSDTGRAYPLTSTLEATETSPAFEPGGFRVACLDMKDGSILVGRLSDVPDAP